MKPKDLKSPFTWKERRPLLQGQLFFVPPYYAAHKRELFPSFSFLFGNGNPVYVEYCSGNGEWIIERALNDQEKNWVAVERDFARVRKIYSKMINREMKNLFIVAGEAYTFSSVYLPSYSIDAVYVHFPDPWPKLRHAKHRLIQAPFAKELRRTLKVGGVATFVTDHLPYKEQIERVMKGWPEVTASVDRHGSSFFHRLWLSKGYSIHHLAYANH